MPPKSVTLTSITYAVVRPATNYASQRTVVPSTSVVTQPVAGTVRDFELDGGEKVVSDTDVTAGSTIIVSRLLRDDRRLSTFGHFSVEDVQPGVGFRVSSYDGRAVVRLTDSASFMYQVFNTEPKGVATLSSGTVIVSDAAALADSVIMLTYRGPLSGKTGHLAVTSRSAGSFTVESRTGDSDVRTDDNNSFNWVIIPPSLTMKGVAETHFGIGQLPLALGDTVPINGTVLLSRYDPPTPGIGKSIGHLTASIHNEGEKVVTSSWRGDVGASTYDTIEKLFWAVFP